MRLLPTTKYYYCSNCHHNFIAFFGFSNVFEQRKHRRYKTRDNVCVRLSSITPEAFPITDISRGGLSFCSTTDKELPTETNELEITYSTENVHIKIPSMIILDYKSENRLSDSNVKTRKFSGKFTNLTRKHKTLLLNNLPKLCRTNG